ncbi:MAG: hypothetical protein QXU54_02110 [Candidatus Micrarchaeia archaeon]
MRTALAILALIIVLQMAYAWTNYTAVYVAKQVLLQDYPHCGDYIEEGVLEVIASEKADAALGEPVNMHCDTLTCPAFDPNYCQTGPKSCKSEVTAGEMKTRAKGMCDCAQAKQLAKAVTYFISKYNPMNLMVRESAACRNGFDGAVENAVRSGNKSWSVSYACDAPNRTFTFTSEKFNEMVFGAKSFAFAEAFAGTSPWYCYTLGGGHWSDNNSGGGQAAAKKAGELCARDDECQSGNCNNNVCCTEGEVCCPVPGLAGYPCSEGERCSDEYACRQIILGDGEVCNSNSECLSGNCKAGSRSALKRYCCAQGNEYCCANDNDCLASERCEQHACVSIIAETGTENNEGTPEEEISQKLLWCLPVILLAFLAAVGYVVMQRS